MAFKCERWTLANLLPVYFVLWVIGTIWALYVSLHLLYSLHIWIPETPGVEYTFDAEMYRRGQFQTVISQFLTLMVLLCFSLAIFTDPGSVPETPEWMPDLAQNDGSGDQQGPLQHEMKHTGAPRFCKWCNCYKPDRCHHCRVCRSCILRMDHHCPWIANCVGFQNHKYFILLVLYALCTCVFISATMSESLHRVLVEEATFVRRFLVVFGMTLSVMMGVLLVLFFSLHIWLILKAMTTIEFCEKAYKRNGANSGQPSMYNLGCYQNLVSVLGSNPLLWLVPCKHPDGDGLHFKINTGSESSSASGHQKSDEGAEDTGETRAGTKAIDAKVDSDADAASVPEVTGRHGSTS